MKCCSACIDDPHLEETVFQRADNAGNCPTCGASSVWLLDAIILRDHFETLIGTYERSDAGDPLTECLRRDWEMFPDLDHPHAKELLTEILDDGEIVRGNFVPRIPHQVDNAAAWESFRSELMFGNRFFPTTGFNLNRLAQQFAYLQARKKQFGATLFRARVQTGDKAFGPAEMGAPPAKLASHGRANPVGIPYLYLASDPSTAISEVRPHRGDTVCVAAVEVPSDLRLVDLRHPRRTVSPFALEDATAMGELRADLDFLTRLGDELTRPVSQREAQFAYLPSQYLCELAKQQGFDGVLYRSSVADGVNVAIFDVAKGAVKSVAQHHVTKVVVESAATD